MMKTDTELRRAGVRALIAALGPVDAERFIAVLHREQSDSSRWRRDQWELERIGQTSGGAPTSRLPTGNFPLRGPTPGVPIAAVFLP